MNNLKSIIIASMRAGALPYQEKNLQLELTIANEEYTVKTNPQSELLIEFTELGHKKVEAIPFRFHPQDQSAITEITLPDSSVIIVVDSWQAADGDIRTAKIEVKHAVNGVATLEWMTEANMVTRTVTHLQPGELACVYKIVGEEEKPFTLVADDGCVIATIDGTVTGQISMDFTKINERLIFKHTGL